MLTAFDISYIDGHANANTSATAAAARRSNDADVDSWVMLDDDAPAGNPRGNRYPATPGINSAPSSTPFVARNANMQRAQPGATPSLGPVDRDLVSGVPVTSASMYMDQSDVTPDRAAVRTPSGDGEGGNAVMTGGRLRAEDAISARMGSDVLSASAYGDGLSASAYGDGLGLANDSMMPFANDSMMPMPRSTTGTNGDGDQNVDKGGNGTAATNRANSNNPAPPSFVPVTPRTPPMAAYRAFTPMTAGNKSVRFNMPLDTSDESEVRPLIASTSPIGGHGDSGNGILRHGGGGSGGSGGAGGGIISRTGVGVYLQSPSTIFGLLGCAVLLVGIVASVVALGMSFHPAAPRRCHDLLIAGGHNSTETICMSTVDLHVLGCGSLPVHAGCTQVAASTIPSSCHLPLF